MRYALATLILLTSSCADVATSGDGTIDATSDTVYHAGGQETRSYGLELDPDRTVLARSDVLAELQIDEPEYTTHHLLQPGVLRSFRVSAPVTGCRIWWSGPGSVRVWQPGP